MLKKFFHTFIVLNVVNLLSLITSTNRKMFVAFSDFFMANLDLVRSNHFGNWLHLCWFMS